MKESAREKSIMATIAILVIGGLLLKFLLPNVLPQDPSECTSSQVYDNSTKRCREKTQAEIDKEKEEERKRELEKLEKEAATGKSNGSICLSAAESWKNIGKTTCVVFYPEYFYETSYGQLFIDEKKNYKTGFVAYFTYRNMLSWEEFIGRYNIGEQIAVYGTIVIYDGHPEIKVSSLAQITEAELINCKTSYGCIYKPGAQL